MLEINLLPEHYKKKKRLSRGALEIILFSLLIVTTIVVVGFHQRGLNKEVRAAKSENEERSSTKSELMGKSGELSDLVEEIEETEDKVEKIKNLRLKQSDIILNLIEITKRVPNEKMWLRSVEMDEQNNILLEGVALDNQSFASYVQDLRELSRIKNIVIEKTSKEEIRELEMVRFSSEVILSAEDSSQEGEDDE